MIVLALRNPVRWTFRQISTLLLDQSIYLPCVWASSRWSVKSRNSIYGPYIIKIIKRFQPEYIILELAHKSIIFLYNKNLSETSFISSFFFGDAYARSEAEYPCVIIKRFHELKSRKTSDQIQGKLLAGAVRNYWTLSICTLNPAFLQSKGLLNPEVNPSGDNANSSAFCATGCLAWEKYRDTSMLTSGIFHESMQQEHSR